MILFAAASLVLIGVVALAIDVGYLLAERRQNQAAVDAAALSAAVAVFDQRTSSEVQIAGKSYGHQNAGVPMSDVDVEWPVAGTGVRTGNDYVKVTITKDVKKFFLGAIYNGNWQVTNTAIAGLEDIPKPYALVALNCPGIDVHGGIQINIGGAGSAMSNCDITNDGNSSIVSVGGAVDAVGTIEENSNWVAPEGFNEGVNAAPDPLAGATPPDPATLTSRAAPTCLSDTVCTIEPGRYANLGTITVKNTVCMKSGAYYLSGTTKIKFQNTSSRLTNQSTYCPTANGGVLLYLAPGSTAALDLGNGKIDLTTSYPIAAAADECAPADAPYPDAPCGMVLWIANGTSFVSSGNAEARFDGVIYAPDSFVELQGTPGSNGLQVIVGTLSLGGNSALNINYRQYVKLARPAVFLVE